ncbi:MAG TPA: hypothetical protein VMR46_00820 [Candidatus Paceibacterota bacterium]|nr:hypothetical protein [Candidatus Paceibacterota bacterium]
MEPTIAYIVTAARSIKDADSKKTSLIDVFDSFTLKKDIKSSSQFFVALIRLLGVPASLDTKVETRIENPKGDIIATTTATGPTITGGVDITNIFGPVEVSEEGKYYLRVWLNGKKLDDGNRYFINVVRVD